MISLFDIDDTEMLACKSGQWWVENEQRGRANNSVVLYRPEVTEQMFKDLFTKIRESGCGEPGLFWTNDKELGTNPCAEIALNAFQFCNLCEINASNIKDQEDFNNRAKAASIIGTLQASYTDFHYLRPQWKETTEREALLGIGMTGIASNKIFNLDIEQAAQIAVNTNKEFSKRVGVNQAARVLCVKPSGTSSLVASCSSGIHAWHSKYYIRRMRFNKEEAIYKYLVNICPELFEDCKFASSTTAILSLPQESPDNAMTRNESALDLLERVKEVYTKWILSGHNTGVNTHNVSVTISVRDSEWDDVRDWMWENRDCYAGISVLPYDGGTYVQAPFEEITEEQYLELVSKLTLAPIDLTKVIEHEDNTNFTENSACAGGACEVK